MSTLTPMEEFVNKLHRAYVMVLDGKRYQIDDVYENEDGKLMVFYSDGMHRELSGYTEFSEELFKQVDKIQFLN